MPKYGIWQERDLALDDLAAEVDRDTLLDAQATTVATHNAEVNAFLSIFVDRETRAQLSVKAGVRNRLQGLDQFGRPKPVKGASRYTVGLPLWKAGTAEGWNFWTQQQMTVRQFADSLGTMLDGDVAWLRDQMLAPFFYAGAGFAYVNESTDESFTVYGLANGDTIEFEKSTGAGTDSHYSAQADPIDAAHNPFPDIYTDLAEHPQNAGRVVAFVPPALVAAISLLSGYAPARREIINVVPATGDETVIPQFAPTLNLPLSATMEHVGTLNSTYIVSWQNMPANYILHVAVDADEKPVAMREYPQPRLQGLVNVGEPRSQFPYQQNNYLRAAGFGARNRVAAHVHRVGSGSYAAPTSFPFPMP